MDPRPILLLEDNPDDVILTQRAVQTAEIQNPLHVAAKIQEAKDYLSKANEGGALPALVILDLHLPDGTGLEFLDWIRSQSAPLRALPVLVVTGSHHRTDEMRAERLGAILFLRKPVDRALLSAAIVHLGLRMSEGQGGSVIVAASA